MNTVPVTVKKVSPGKTAELQAKALLAKPHTLPTLLLALLFCLLASVIPYGAQRLFYYAAYLLLKSDLWLVIIELLLTAFGVLAFWLFAMPLWLARLRMAGLLIGGTVPAATEIFYSFSSRSRYFRALRVGGMALLLLLLPLLAVCAMVAGAINAFQLILTSFGIGYALLSVPPLVFAVLWLSLLVLFLSGLLRLFLAVAIGNEMLSVRESLMVALQFGRKNLKALFLFALKNLLLLLLSLATVGVLHVLWFSHYYTLSYLNLSIILTSKENEI